MALLLEFIVELKKTLHVGSVMNTKSCSDFRVSEIGISPSKPYNRQFERLVFRRYVCFHCNFATAFSATPYIFF